MELKATNHSYSCLCGNFYDSNQTGAFNSFDEFMAIRSHDDDYHFLFRYDLKQIDNENFYLQLCFMLQRKGIYQLITIENVKEDDMPQIEKYLSERWQYMKGQWAEFSNQICFTMSKQQEIDAIECEKKAENGQDKDCSECSCNCCILQI